MALKKPMDLKTKIGLMFWEEEQTVWERREGEKKTKRGRRREEEKEGDQAKVWKLTLIMDSMRFGMDHMEFV